MQNNYTLYGLYQLSFFSHIWLVFTRKHWPFKCMISLDFSLKWYLTVLKMNIWTEKYIFIVHLSPGTSLCIYIIAYSYPLFLSLLEIIRLFWHQWQDFSRMIWRQCLMMETVVERLLCSTKTIFLKAFLKVHTNLYIWLKKY